MNRLGLEQFRRNAYRVLGLKADATQQEIDRAARLMRLVENAAPGSPDVAVTPQDAVWLGPVDRSAKSIERAVVTLADPESRCQERVWWFCVPPATDTPRGTEMSAMARHDAVLAACCRLMISGQSVGHIGRWNAVIDEVEKAGKSDGYLSWLLEAEEKGDFEKRASAEELAESQAQMPERIDSVIIGIGEDALDYEDFAGVGTVIRTLREHRGSAARYSATEGLLNRMEDKLAGQCNEWHEKISQAWKTARIETIKPVCQRALVAYEQELRNLMGELAGQSADDEGRRERAWGHVIKMLEHVADAYEACYDKWNTRRALEKALVVATGTVAEGRIRQRLEKTMTAAAAAPVEAGRSKRGVGQKSAGPSFSLGGGCFGGFGLLVVILIRLLAAGGMALTHSNDAVYDPVPQPAPSDIQRMQNDPQFQSGLKALQDYEARKAAEQHPGGNPLLTPLVPTVPSTPQIQPLVPGGRGR